MRLREGNKEADIISAAISVFAETGYEATRMANIALKAGIATGTLYLYFKNKEVLLDHIVANLWKEIDIVVTESTLDQCSLSDQFSLIVDGVLAIFEEHPEQAKIFTHMQNSSLSASGSQAVLQRGEQMVIEAKERQEINEKIDPQIFTHFFFGSIRSLIILWASDPQKHPLSKIKAHLHGFISGGLELAGRGIV